MLIEKAVEKINEIKHMPYEGDEHIYMSQMIMLNSLIKEMKLRNLTLEKNTMIKNIFLDYE